MVFQRLKTRCPRAYNALGEERRQEMVEQYEHYPYMELQRRVYPNNPDKDDYLESHLAVLVL